MQTDLQGRHEQKYFGVYVVIETEGALNLKALALSKHYTRLTSRGHQKGRGLCCANANPVGAAFKVPGLKVRVELIPK